MSPADFDQAVLLLVNSPATRWPAFDAAVFHINANHMFKGNFAAMVVAWVLFMPASDRRVVLNGVAGALAAMLVAMALARGLQMLLPVSLRPIHTPGLDLLRTAEVAPVMLEGWSSMPSDHAMMFVALAVGILKVHRLAGLVLLAHAILIASLPRVYLGLHWPSDILVGAVAGAAVAMVLQPVFARLAGRVGLDRFALAHAPLAAAGAVFVLIQIGVMFEPVRWFAGTLGEIMGMVASMFT